MDRNPFLTASARRPQVGVANMLPDKIRIGTRQDSAHTCYLMPAILAWQCIACQQDEWYSVSGSSAATTMYFEQFYLTCLAHASYMIGSGGEAAVIDPQRDVDLYLEAADEQGLKIRHIFESHLHADFVSGHKELAARTGATIYIRAPAHARFPHTPLQT